jgi:hypothetical protein
MVDASEDLSDPVGKQRQLLCQEGFLLFVGELCLGGERR